MILTSTQGFCAGAAVSRKLLSVHAAGLLVTTQAPPRGACRWKDPCPTNRPTLHGHYLAHFTPSLTSPCTLLRDSTQRLSKQNICTGKCKYNADKACWQKNALLTGPNLTSRVSLSPSPRPDLWGEEGGEQGGWHRSLPGCKSTAHWNSMQTLHQPMPAVACAALCCCRCGEAWAGGMAAHPSQLPSPSQVAARFLVLAMLCRCHPLQLHMCSRAIMQRISQAARRLVLVQAVLQAALALQGQHSLRGGCTTCSPALLTLFQVADGYSCQALFQRLHTASISHMAVSTPLTALAEAT